MIKIISAPKVKYFSLNDKEFEFICQSIQNSPIKINSGYSEIYSYVYWNKNQEDFENVCFSFEYKGVDYEIEATIDQIDYNKSPYYDTDYQMVLLPDEAQMTDFEIYVEDITANVYDPDLNIENMDIDDFEFTKDQISQIEKLLKHKLQNQLL